MTILIEIAGALAINPELTKTAAELMRNLLGEPCKVAGNMMADQIYYWQWLNRIRIANKAQKIMEENEVAAKVLPAGFLVPLLDAAGNVEDETLQDLFARLLVSGIENEDNQHPAFVSILKEMSHDEAIILQEIAYLHHKKEHDIRVFGGFDDSSRPRLIDVVNITDDDFKGVKHRNKIISHIDHLEQMGIINGNTKTFRGEDMTATITTHIVLTSWGQSFAAACLPPSLQ